MTPKQLRFVQEYLIDLNATQAAIRAGYAARSAEVTGCRLLRNVKVHAAIEAEQAKTAGKFELTHEMVLGGLLTEARRTGDGTSHGARVTAWTQLGKHSSLAMWRDVVEHRNTLSELTDQELEHLATGRSTGIAGPTNGAAKPGSVH